MRLSSFITCLSAFFTTSTFAAYSATSKTNVAIYYGQGPNEGTSNGYTLRSFCSQTSLDIIVIGFVNVFPSQGNGYPGTNFGSNCWAGNPTNYPGPGWAGVKNSANDHLIIDCHLMTQDLQFCKASGKTILLSIGGGTNTYTMTDDSNNEGIYTADFLWNAFGPYNASWTGPRPFDYNGYHNSVDGFDFDIEYHSSDIGYIKMIARLRSLFPSGSQYLITGAPQCIYPDANMGKLFSWVVFDILFIQFYNSDPCSARDWATYNANYPNTGKETLSHFTFRQWQNGLANTVNKNTKLFIGLLGSTAATSADSKYYISPAEADSLIQAYYCDAQFGGVAIYEATYSQFNFAGPFHQSVKRSLLRAGSNTNLTCVQAAAPKNNFVVPSSTLSTITTTTTTTKSSTVTSSASTSSILVTTASTSSLSRVTTTSISPLSPAAVSTTRTSQTSTTTSTSSRTTTTATSIRSSRFRRSRFQS